MKISKRPRLQLLAAVACALALPAAAAQAQQAESPLKISLRVVIHSRAAPTFYPLPDEDKQGSGGVIRDFGRLPSARFLSGPPVDAVSLGFAREGGAARVSVYVHRGSEGSRENLKVAEYVIAEGHEQTVVQLAAYGVEPMRLSVVRRVEIELVPPRVWNRTKGVEVSEIKIHPEVPSFELVLRNASDKDLRAIEIEENRGWMPKGPPPGYDWKSRVPVRPGKTFSVVLEFGWNGKATPEGHAIEPPDRVDIKSALFGDGTYEGDSLFAARAEALREGRRVQLKRVLEMFRELGETPGDYTFVQGLVLRVEMLETSVEWPAVSEFAGRYGVYNGAEMERLKSMIESGMQSQRSLMLSELRGFFRQVSPAAGPVAFERLLKVLRESYEKTLAEV